MKAKCKCEKIETTLIEIRKYTQFYTVSLICNFTFNDIIG